MDRIFDYQIIPEFGGTVTDEPVIQWTQCIKMIYNPCKGTDMKQILLMHLHYRLIHCIQITGRNIECVSSKFAMTWSAFWRMVDGLCICVRTATACQVASPGIIKNGCHDIVTTRDPGTDYYEWGTQRDCFCYSISMCKCDIVCYNCSGPNHLARDCLQGCAEKTWFVTPVLPNDALFPM